MSPAGCEAREHVKVDQDVVHELGAEDEEAHPGAVLDTDDADRGEPAPRPPERCLGDGGVGVPALVGPVLRVPGSWDHDVISCHCDNMAPVLHHEPAQPQPRAHEGPIDREVEDESDARRAGVGQGSWSHSILLLLLLLLLWCTWQHEDAAPRHLARDEDGGEEEPHARPRPGSLLPSVLGDLLILGHIDNTTRAKLRGVGWSAWKQLLIDRESNPV